MWIALRLVHMIQQFVDSIWPEERNADSCTEMLPASVKYFVLPNKLRQQQSERVSILDQVHTATATKIPIIYLEEDCSEFLLVSGVRCEQGILQGIALPEHRSSVRQIFGIEELDDDGQRKYGPWKEKDYSRKKTATGLLL